MTGVGLAGVPGAGVLPTGVEPAPMPGAPPPPPQADSKTTAAQAEARRREKTAGRPGYASDELMRTIIDPLAMPIATKCNSWVDATPLCFEGLRWQVLPCAR